MLIVGTGKIAREYAKVFKHLKIPFKTIGHTREGGEAFQDWCLENDIETKVYYEIQKDTHAIIAVSINVLLDMAKKCLLAGISNVLIEKPGSLFSKDLFAFHETYNVMGDIRIAYNRRFYNTTKAVKELCKIEDIYKLYFKFGENLENLVFLDHPQIVKDRWVVANSSHLIDLAFYMLGGLPTIYQVQSNKNNYCMGNGITGETKFKYRVNPKVDKRWYIEFYTKANNKYVLNPIERLSRRGSNSELELITSDEWEDGLKPGFLGQVKSFISDKEGIPTILETAKLIRIVEDMGGITGG